MTRFEVTRLLKFWDYLRSSYWFLPTIIVLFSALFALLLINADHHYRIERLSGASWLFLSKAESARMILSTISTAMITIVSLTFSMTIVVLTLASSQFGPRLLYNFMRDRNNQVALGVFLACFVFCLIVLRAVQSGSAGDFVPHLGLTVALLYALFSIGMLIFYIHHIADSIQATTVIANVRSELELIVQRMLPEDAEERARETEEGRHLLELVESDSMSVKAQGRGTLQTIEQENLLQWAYENDLLIRLHRHPGEFVIPGSLLFEVFPRERVPLDSLDQLQAYFRFGDRRTLVQDVEFAFQQLVEIALRALSPSINDPFTAMSCVNELGAGLVLVAKRGSQTRIQRDTDGQPRLLVKVVDFKKLVDGAFNQVRQSCCDYPALMMCMLETIAVMASLITNPQQRMALRRHAVAIHAMAGDCCQDPNDLRGLSQQFHRASSLLGGADQVTD